MRLPPKLQMRVCFLTAMILCLSVFAAQAAVDPVAVELHYQRGVKLYNNGLYEKAILEFEKVLSLDPSHAQAKEYLETVQTALKSDKLYDGRKSKDERLKKLYREGRQRYKSRDYEGAIEIFNKILELKPVDDFASYYKERCEIIMASRLAKEKKIEAKKKARLEREAAIRTRIREREARKQARIQEKEARRQAALGKKSGASQVRSQPKERIAVSREVKDLSQEIIKEKKKEARNELIGTREQKKLTAREEKIAKKKRAREEKIMAAKERKEEKLRRREEKLRLKQERIAERNEKIRAKKEAKDKARQEKSARSRTKKIAKQEDVQQRAELKDQSAIPEKSILIQPGGC